jgi:hypothetical protein
MGKGKWEPLASSGLLRSAACHHKIRSYPTRTVTALIASWSTSDPWTLLMGEKTTLTSNAGCPQDLERRSPTRAEDARGQAELISCLKVYLRRGSARGATSNSCAASTIQWIITLCGPCIMCTNGPEGEAFHLWTFGSAGPTTKSREDDVENSSIFFRTSPQTAVP